MQVLTAPTTLQGVGLSCCMTFRGGGGGRGPLFPTCQKSVFLEVPTVLHYLKTFI